MKLAPVVILITSIGYAQQPVDFQQQVHPVLAAKCFACHGGDKRSGGLSLSSYQNILEGGRSGAVLIPGTSSDSLLIRRTNGTLKPVMPPVGPPLTAAEISILEAWINQGARPVHDGPAAKPRWVPELKLHKPDQTAEQILRSYFSRNKLENPQVVSDRIFARRVYLDLWGFLPSPEQLREFTTDRGSDKRQRLVRQLLSHSENYAGHWMTFWNDLLRNEDAFGIYGGDRQSISNWLEGVLKENLPYDEFLKKLLNPTSKEDPNGFIVGVNWRGDSSAAQMPWIQAAQNSAQVFMGINLKCNSCHDSFISRWTLKDAYGLAAFFSPESKLELVRCDAATGNFTGPGFLYPELNKPTGDSLPDRHAAVAEMFTTKENGRTPRTIVNRIWAQLMGRGIVETVDDMDNEPWSPELLDRLSSDFVDSGYDLKKLIETIMLLPTYQLPSQDGSQASGDYVFRGPEIRRMTAEQFIDSLSAITGEWPIIVPRTAQPARHVRESRRNSSPLSRALGRPNRDQVITSRSSEATTLQMLELVNGQDLYQLIYRGSQKLMGQDQPAPAPLFDSGVVNRGSKPVQIDLDISGATRLYLVVADFGSYAPELVKTAWKTQDFGTIEQGATGTYEIDLKNSKVTRFQATAIIDRISDRSDITPQVRFFVFREKPNPQRLVSVLPQTPVPFPQGPFTKDQLITRIFQQALGRDATDAEKKLVGDHTKNPEALADFLWAISMTPEFQLII